MDPSRLSLAALALAGAGFVLAACGSDAGSAPGSDKPTSSTSTSSPPVSSPPVSSPPASSLPAPGTGAGSPTASGSGRTGSCIDAQAKYCDDFGDASSGWPTQNTQAGYEQYDAYLGGTYRIGLRGQGTVSQPAPVRLSTVSPTYSVQVDTDVTLGQTSSSTTSVGLRCWAGTTSDGKPTGFLLLVDGSRAMIGVNSSLSGESTPIASKPFTGLKTGRTNHIAVQCLQVNGSTGVEARMAIRVNGVPAVSASYGKSVRQVSWQPTDRVSIVARGANADAFYDNVSIAPVTVS